MLGQRGARSEIGRICSKEVAGVSQCLSGGTDVRGKAGREEKETHAQGSQVREV